jgi:hypothetical protein
MFCYDRQGESHVFYKEAMMISRFKPLIIWIIPALCCLILPLLLVACGDSTPSTSALTPLSSPSHGLIIYTGHGYSISYPQGWGVPTSAANGTVVFKNAAYDAVPRLFITVAPNPGGALSPDAMVTTGLKSTEALLTDPHIISIASTVTVAGESWSQRAVAGSATVNGESATVQYVVIAANHPAKGAATMSFTISYGETQALFDTTNSSTFQVMLHSFTFSQ